MYVLINSEKNRTYIGCAKDLLKRIEEHNKGAVRSSRAYGPYKILYKEKFETLKEARAKEKYYKSTSGRRQLKKLFK